MPGVSARFGTDPFIWNWAMWLVARVCPRQFLQDRSQVNAGLKFVIHHQVCISVWLPTFHKCVCICGRVVAMLCRCCWCARNMF